MKWFPRILIVSQIEAFLNRLSLHLCVYSAIKKKTPIRLLTEWDSYIRLSDFYSILLYSSPSEALSPR